MSVEKQHVATCGEGAGSMRRCFWGFFCAATLSFKCVKFLRGPELEPCGFPDHGMRDGIAEWADKSNVCDTEYRGIDNYLTVRWLMRPCDK